MRLWLRRAGIKEVEPRGDPRQRGAMKIRRASACAALVWLGAGLAQAAPEFTGYLTGPGESRFVITDAATRQRSGLLATGQSFEGYQIIAFDREREVLTLQRGTETLHLNLKNASAPAYAAIPLSSQTNHPVPAGGRDLIATREDRAKFLKKIQKAMKDLPEVPDVRPRKF